MNLYYYWFFTIYSLFHKLARNDYFDVSAVGVFSIVIGFLYLGLYGIILVFLSCQYLYFNKPLLAITPILIIALINFLIFIPKKRQIMLREKYQKDQSKRKDILSVLLSLVSLGLFVISTILFNT